MTEDQIAELERLNQEAHRAPWRWDGEAVVADDSLVPAASHIIAWVKDAGYNDRALMTIARNVLPRLLEERKRLLEALDSVIGQVEDACINDCGICRFCVSEGVARKAIAFAEEAIR